MKKYDHYVAGSHPYWTHFWCGLLLGAGIGAWIGWWGFDECWAVPVTAIAVSLVVAYSCGRWGDQAWDWIIQRLWWIT